MRRRGLSSFSKVGGDPMAAMLSARRAEVCSIMTVASSAALGDKSEKRCEAWTSREPAGALQEVRRRARGLACTGDGDSKSLPYLTDLPRRSDWRMTTLPRSAAGYVRLRYLAPRLTSHCHAAGSTRPNYQTAVDTPVDSQPGLAFPCMWPPSRFTYFKGRKVRPLRQRVSRVPVLDCCSPWSVSSRLSNTTCLARSSQDHQHHSARLRLL